MLKVVYSALASAVGVVLALGPACAHVTLERAQAPVGASYKAVVRVPHGCAGKATTALRIRIPEGFVGVKPMPKAGWTLATKTEPYGRTYEVGHAKLSEGVREIAWSGSALPDDQYDEFIFVGTVAPDLAPDSVIYFPTVQDCDSGTERWIDIPAAGGSARDLKAPAPALRLVAPTAAAH